jgi:RHS repeat-associated protein
MGLRVSLPGSPGQYPPYIGLALGASITAFQTEEGVPIAYLKYIVLDQDSAYVYSDVQVISSAAGQSWQELKLNYKAEQEGFVQVFVYNESGQEVFFDDITIRKDPALIVQENHYDPWGMNLVGIEMQGRPDHKFQYNGKEKQEELGLHWNDYGARFYDPQLGRFTTIDPLANVFSSETPYHYVHNNPLLFTDPTGMGAVYNWETGKYMDGDKEVSWDEAKRQHGIEQESGDHKDNRKQAKETLSALAKRAEKDPWGASGAFYGGANELAWDLNSPKEKAEAEDGLFWGAMLLIPAEGILAWAGRYLLARRIAYLSRLSVEEKLLKYLLNISHPVGGSKAKWFKEALGFTVDNADDLANQIVFNSKTAIQTGVTEFGVKYNQVISISGANGKVIDVTFAWIKNNDGVVRLVTGIPTK